MIAMQYSFVLPADYDMAIIERRIREKGSLLDGFPRLRFKAYLSARKQGAGFTSAENLYAPFYLWDEPEGISDFLTSSGFTSLTRDFGWPIVRTWIVWHTELGSNLGAARFASREIMSITPYSDLILQQDKAIVGAQEAMHDGALASVAAFDPTSWTMMRFRLWRTPPATTNDATQTYAVGHVSLPKQA